MKYMVNVTFVPGEQETISALLPAERAHVGRLLEQGVMDRIHVAADRSHIWVAVNGETQDDVRQTMSELPLYPYMQLEYTPLLDIEAARDGNVAAGAGERGAE
jgi:muconolactone delta-isomerase